MRSRHTPSYTLTVTKGGAGSGSVTSNPAGVSCGSDCSESYVSGTSVTLTAAATGGSAFVGWGGVCAEFGAAPICSFIINSVTTVSAAFNPPPPPGSYTLTVSKGGTGTGSVTSNPTGIDCGGTCSAPFTSGAIVTLTATPTGGATFAGWTGGCNSSGQVTLDADKTCTATFNPPSNFSLNVTATGSGSGNVTSSVGGISCGVGNSGTCGSSIANGAGVTLTAAPTGGSTFDGWGGDCAGFGTGLTCTLTMDSAKTVSATFTAPPTPASPAVRTFLTTDVITVEHTYYDPNDACLGVPPVSLKFFVFTLEGQLVLGRNRDTTGGVTNTQIGTSKFQTLLATLDPGALPPGTYNLIFRVEPCTSTPEHQDVYVSEFYAIEVFAAP